jgi:hypothetical protein
MLRIRCGYYIRDFFKKNFESSTVSFIRAGTIIDL